MWLLAQSRVTFSASACPCTLPGPSACYTRLALTRAFLCRLHLLFDKNLERALQIVDKGDVKCYVAEKSGRTVYQVCFSHCSCSCIGVCVCGALLVEGMQVKGKTAADPYTVFPLHYCSCHAFLYDVLGLGGNEQVLVRVC